ncbi:394_t:CDS:1 [Diversispora eburnea]|uniref:394_t:CDS:1 n=1 Tax=Diversispora eburnea TaxID=1213867 RepID=A0A9N9AE19_9GLOM|nr:394_t:CDS:1 [Diversispora eburnea]
MEEKTLYSKIHLNSASSPQSSYQMRDNKTFKMKEEELYSKAHVAGCIKYVVDKESDEDVELTANDKFSCNLATMLARDKEVVAVNLKTYSNSCIIYISKNNAWFKEDVEYIEKIQIYLRSISKYEPMTWFEALRKDETSALCYEVMKYCSSKFDSRYGKLKKDLIDGKEEQHVKSFTEYISNYTKNIDEEGRLAISQMCCFYYKGNKDKNIPKIFLKHIKEVGSYVGSFINITDCACNQKYKTLFSQVKLHRLNPDIIHKPICSWKSIIHKLIPNSKTYQGFKEACLNDRIISERLIRTYDSIERLDLENINKHIYLHAELNIVSNIINQKIKTRSFIAVSKKCCFLCELYIKFAQQQGYNIVISGAHKKIYHAWKHPDTIDVTFKRNSQTYILKELDQIIMEEIKRYIDLRSRSDSDAGSVDSHIIEDIDDFSAYAEFKSIAKSE